MQVFQFSDRQIWFYDGLVWQNMTATVSPSPGFDILYGGEGFNTHEHDKFDGNSTSGDVLLGGTY